MGFFSGLTHFVSQVFASADDSVQKSLHLLTHPSEAMALKEDLVTPRDVSYQGFFRKVDPVLDILSPSHNVVQTGTTGSSTTEGQSPYFEKIAPVVVSAFFPAAGAFLSGVDGVSQGNTTQAVLGFTSWGVSSYTSALSSGVSDVQAAGGTVSASTISNLQTAQTLGTVVKVGAGAYKLYDAQDKLIAVAGVNIPNMINDKQAYSGISQNTGTQGGAYNYFTHTQDTTGVAAQMAYDSQKTKGKDYMILAVGALALYYMR